MPSDTATRMAKNAPQALTRWGASVVSLAKVIGYGRWWAPRELPAWGQEQAFRGKPLVLLGNGPSLAHTLRDHLPALQATPTWAVNHFARTEAFTQVRPAFYSLHDPSFYRPDRQRPPDAATLDALVARTDWPLKVVITHRAEAYLRQRFRENANLTLHSYTENLVKGHEALRFRWYRRVGSPRLANTLNAVLWAAINARFQEVYLLGVELTHLRNLDVLPDNRLVMRPAHFYNQPVSRQPAPDAPETPSDAAETPSGAGAAPENYQVVERRSAADYLEETARAMRSFTDLGRYARHRGTRVWNATPGGLLDGLTRKPWPPTP